MKRGWIGLSVAVVVLALAAGGYMMFVNPPGDVDIEGRWELVSGSEPCYAGVRFMRGMTPAEGGVSTEAREGNVVQMAYGNYVKSGERLTLNLNNPPAEPIEMTIVREEEQLQLQYAQDGEQLSCTYAIVGE